jgi:hypothetical protein
MNPEPSAPSIDTEPDRFASDELALEAVRSTLLEVFSR